MVKKLFQFIGYGVIIWLVAFLVGSLLLFLKVKTISQDLFDVIITLSVAISAYLLARTVQVEDNRAILKYSVTWVLITAVLDILVTMRLSGAGWSYFYNLYIWFGYGLILLVPSLTIPAIPPEQRI